MKNPKKLVNKQHSDIQKNSEARMTKDLHKDKKHNKDFKRSKKAKKPKKKLESENYYQYMLKLSKKITQEKEDAIKNFNKAVYQKNELNEVFQF